MSRHEIETEGLPEGLEPQEIRKPRLGDIVFFGAGIAKPWDTSAEGTYPALILRRKVRKYDWGKTHSSTLVTRVDQDGYWTCGISFALGKQACIADLWQPNIHGKCPVDGEASWVRVRLSNGSEYEKLAKDVIWDLDLRFPVTVWQFIRLVDGVEF